MNKPTKPNITIPKSFAANGEKNDFNDDMLLNGFDRIKQEVVPGDALNKFIDDSYQGLNYSMDGVDDLYKGIVLYSATETYNTTSLVFNISEAGIKLYHSLVNNNKGNSLTDATKWEEVSLGGGLPVGFIFWGSYSEDYVPENSLKTDGTEFTAASGQMFNQLWTDFILTGKLDTCSYAEYETEVTMTGSCWKWAVDTANEKFRIPFIPDKILTDIDDIIGVRGNGKAIGLTDGTNNIGLSTRLSGQYYYLSGYDDIYGQNVGTTASGEANFSGNKISLGMTPDTSKSGAEADATSAKTYKTIRHYVVVATGSINQSEADWSEFASSLASKANIDLSNVTQSSGLRRLIEVSDSSLMPSWYKVFEEKNPQTGEVKKWCEQGGLVAGGSSEDNVTLLRNFVDRNYSVITTHNYTASTSNYGSIVNIVNNSSFTIYSYGDGAKKCNKIWQASGYIS